MAELPVLDPTATARADVERLRGTPSISSQIAISGFAYDLKSGLLSQVA